MQAFPSLQVPHTQSPSTQSSPTVHSLPQAPQCSVSLLRFTHPEPGQQVSLDPPRHSSYEPPEPGHRQLPSSHTELVPQA